MNRQITLCIGIVVGFSLGVLTDRWLLDMQHRVHDDIVEERFRVLNALKEDYYRRFPNALMTSEQQARGIVGQIQKRKEYTR